MNWPAKISVHDPVYALLDLVETLQELDRSAFAILKTMEIAGARVWFQSGTHRVRFHGVVGTSTVGGAELINAWLRAVRRYLGLGEVSC
jgi:hypothetical protein